MAQPSRLRWFFNTETTLYFIITALLHYHAFIQVYLPQVQPLLDQHSLGGVAYHEQSYFALFFHINQPQDVADVQLRTFLSNVPILFSVALIFITFSQLIQFTARDRLSYFHYRKLFYFLFSAIFLVVLCGSKVIFLLILVTFNYITGRFLLHAHSSIYIGYTWIWNCSTLLLNEYCHGYRFSSLFGHSLRWLDSSDYKGLMSWESSYNLVVLKLISYNMDQLWAVQNKPVVDQQGNTLTLQQHAIGCDECSAVVELSSSTGRSVNPCYSWREKCSHPSSDYSFTHYFIYLFYVPLYFAGPTISFNAFFSYIKQPAHTLTDPSYLKYLLIYAFRWLFVFLLLEVFLHYFYIYSMFNSGQYVHLTTAAQCAAVYLVLIMIWLKFVYLWRFFRLWALLDCVEPIENMNRCISNNYSVQQFWKSWHRSFNRWLVRYIYIPMGGGRQSILQTIVNIVLVFTFVAFWHDRTLNLLTWGWLIALLFVPEVIMKAALNTKTLRHLRDSRYFRHVAAAGYALNIFMMMLANFIGYSIGVGGSKTILTQLTDLGNVPLMVYTFFTFYTAVHVMFRVRELEHMSGYVAVDQKEIKGNNNNNNNSRED